MTPLGPRESWPPSLKTVVDLMLAAPQMATLAVGPKRIFLYNDEAAQHYGARKYEILGCPLAEAFSHEFHKVAPFYDRVFAGEGMHVPAQSLDPAQAGSPDTFDAYLTPVRDSDGIVLAALMMGVAAGDRERAEAALRDSEARLAGDLAGIRRVHALNSGLAAENELGSALGAIAEAAVELAGTDRGCIQLVSQDGERLEMFAFHGYAEHDPFIQHFMHAGSKPACDAARRDRRRMEIEDVATCPALADTPDRAVALADGVLATNSTPMLSRAGELLGVLSVQFREPHLASDAQNRLLDLLAWTAADFVDRHQATARLGASEARFRALVTTGAVTVYRMSPDWRLMYQLDSKDFLAPTAAPDEHWIDRYILPGDHAAVSEAIGRATRDKSIFELEHRVTLADGNVGWINSRAVPMLGPDGEIVEWFGAGSDITERKRAEQALQQSETDLAHELANTKHLQEISSLLIEGEDDEALYGRLLDAAMAIMRADFASLQRFDADSNELRLLGHRNFHPDSAKFWDCVSISTGTTCGVALREGERVFAPDGSTFDPDGREHYELSGIVSIQSTPLISRDGRLIGMISTHWRQQVTPDEADFHSFDILARQTADAFDRSRVEAALRDNEERLRLVVENARGHAIFTTDPDGIIDAWWAGAEKVFGWSADEAVGQSIDILFTAEDRANEQPRHELETASERGSAPDVRWHVRKNGALVFIDGLVVPLKASNNQISGFLKIGQDVTERHGAEEALRQSEQRLQRVLETDAVGVLFFREDGTLIGGNHVFSQMSGYSAAELGSGALHWRDLTPPEWVSESESQMAGFAETGRVGPYEKEYLNKDGSRSWMLFAGRGLGDGTLVEFAIDISQRKAAEAALAASEERLRQFGKASQDVLWIRGAEDLQWVYLTPAFEPIYGLTCEEALSGNNYRGWLDLIVPEDRQHASDSIGRVRNGEHVTFDFRIKRPADGAIRWMRNTDFPILDEHGEITLIGGIGHDATDLREAELRLQTLIENIPQLVWRAVDHGHWTWASPQWKAYTGQSEVDSKGKGWLEALHPDDRASALDAWSDVIEQGGFKVEYRLRSAARQEYFWFQTRATPVRDAAGAIIEWIGTSTDIHDLRELQDHQQVLVAELQHRTRNLMAVVRSTADKTARASDDIADFRARFQVRLESLARVQGLLSRLSELDRVTFDELIRSELSVVESGEDRVTLQGPIGVRLRSSTVQILAMALHELATNAVKYGALSGAGGSLAITWSIEPTGDDGQRWLYIDWRESGVIMPQPDAAPTGTGQGRELIERALPYQLKARTSYVLGQDGVHCTILVPISASTRDRALNNA